MNHEFAQRVRAWIALDPDERDRATLEQLLDDDNEAELRHHFDPVLTFGTAGLRGPEMAGPAGMNRLSVRRATQGVIAWLAHLGLDPDLGVVVGRDARLGSERFNDEVVSVLLGADLRVYEMPGPLPTPLVAYAVKRLGAAAGIMITASHNPAVDNGFKLFAHDGSQIVSPNDTIVEAAMARATTPALGTRDQRQHEYISAALLSSYREHMLGRFAVTANEFPIVYTPLHGVGGAFVTGLLADAGYQNVSVVSQQMAPDPTFPTVAFPNPEEPGALDLAFALAREGGAAIILANDPDADRLSVAAHDTQGQWRALRGDEIGWLLGDALLPQAQPGDVVATTIVSSTMLAAMARAAGVPYVDTLTGFKWVSKAAGRGRLLFGYEEALGYGVDAVVGDKDGLSGALAFAQLAFALAVEGRTVFDRLDDLEAQFGVHAGDQLSLRVEAPRGREVLEAVMQRVRSGPPREIAGLALREVIDLEEGWRGLPPTEGLIWHLGESSRVVVRPSGTEPKLKAYIEVVREPAEDLRASRQLASELVETIRGDLRKLLSLVA